MRPGNASGHSSGVVRQARRKHLNRALRSLKIRNSATTRSSDLTRELLMRNYMIAFAALLSLITWCGLSTYAEPNPSGKNSSKTNAKDGTKPKPEEILRKMTDYIGGLPAYSFHIDSSVELKATGIDHKFATKMTVKFQKPNRLALRVEDGQAGVTVVSDGKF